MGNLLRDDIRAERERDEQEALREMDPRYAGIVVSFEYPPIPERCFDYRAMRDGNDESGPYGWGATRFQAIADLLEIETA